MEKSSRVRQKRQQKRYTYTQQFDIGSIKPPEGLKFIISPYICFEASYMIKKQIKEGVNEIQAIKQLLLRAQNLDDEGGFISIFEKQLKTSLSELDNYWINNYLNIKYTYTRQIDPVRTYDCTQSFRQTYFNKHPNQKHNTKNPINRRSVQQFKDKADISFGQLQDIYNEVVCNWQTYTKKQKGSKLKYYEILLHYIFEIIELKKLDDVPLSLY